MASNQLQGRVALITGASRGIGRATARQLAAQGAVVIVNYFKQDQAASQVTEEIRAAGGQALALQADVGDAASAAAMLERAADQLGPVDILVNNAGILHRAELAQYDEAVFDAMWRTNVKGVVHCIAAAVPSMAERGFGRIVNVSSVAALGTAVVGTSFYAATKAAVLTLTRRFAYELGGQGIRVNAVCPGFILTDMVDGEQAWMDSIIAKSSLGRVGQPEDIARVIAFLVSEASDFMNGQVLSADGGRMDFLTHS